MDSVKMIENNMTEKLRTPIKIESRGLDDYRVALPFQFSDGDSLKIILKKIDGGRWRLTDEGHTLMFLSYYDVNINAGERANILKSILESHFIENNDGRLQINVESDHDAASAIFTFAQGILKVSDIAMWKKESIKSLFYEFFRESVIEGAKGRRTEFDVIYEEFDPNKLYPIDSRITLKNNRQVHVYAAGSQERAKTAIISMSHYERFKFMVPNCIVLSPDVNFGKTVLQIEEVADKILYSPDVTKTRLDTFLQKYEYAA